MGIYMKAFRFTLILSLMLNFCLMAGNAQSVYSTIRMKVPSISQADTSKVNSLARAGIKYNSSKPPKLKETKACIDTALYICEKEDIEIPAILHLLMAEYNMLTGDYLNASGEATLAMEKAERNGENNILVRTLFFLGGYYSRTGFFKESVANYTEGIALAKEKGLKGITPIGYSALASVYNDINDLKANEETLWNLIEQSKEEKDSAHLAIGLYLLGSLKIERSRDFKLADSLLKESYALSSAIGDTAILARSLANIGYNYYLEREFSLGIETYKNCLKYAIAADDISLIANIYGNMGTIYRDMGDRERSVKFYTKAIDYATKIHDWYNLYWIYQDMSKMYLIAKDTANAFKNYILFKKYSDSTIIKNRNRWISESSIKYKVDTQQKEVQLLSLKLKNQRTLSLAFGILVPLALAVGLLLWRGTKLKNKRRISEMNRQISEIQQANLRQQMNPHFIFNTLNSIQYYMYQHDKLATNNYLTKFSNLMRKVLENSQHTYIPLTDELNALTLYLELESIRFKDKFDYEIIVDEEIDPLMYKVPTMLIQPYVENSICHGLMPMETKGKVKIDIKLVNDYLTCTIEDNGVGRDAARERKTEKEGNHNSLGTRIASSRLELVNALYGSCLKTTYTDLKDPDGRPAGTRVEMQIPVIT
jgi:tetratricopeptide (TPR) repeat protein